MGLAYRKPRVSGAQFSALTDRSWPTAAPARPIRAPGMCAVTSCRVSGRVRRGKGPSGSPAPTSIRLDPGVPSVRRQLSFL